MRGYCAKCAGTFDGQMLCPNCGVQLIEDTAGPTSSRPLPAVVGDEPSDGPSFARRLFVGTLLTIGLYHGLKHAANAYGIYSTGEVAPDPWPLVELGFALLGAGFVAGTANRRAEVAGLLLALGAAGAWFGPTYSEDPPTIQTLIGLPMAFAVIAMFGGLVGRYVVPPAPKLPAIGPFDGRAIEVPKRSPRARMSYPKVLLGAILVVAGTVFADDIRQSMSRAFAGRGGGFTAVKLIGWQISAIAGLLGGALAGAQSRAAIRQGLAAGIVAAIGTIAVYHARGFGTFPVTEFWMDQLELGEIGPVVYLVVGVGVALATAIGGGLGSQIWPPKGRREPGERRIRYQA